MQTMTLFAYQTPSRVEALLESLLQAREHFPRKARKVTDRSELPSALQTIVIRLKNCDRVWSAWAIETRFWFFTAEMSLELSRERGCPALQVGSYEVDGKLKVWQLWACLKDGTWQQCAP
jgi:hypothetical protein